MQRDRKRRILPALIALVMIAVFAACCIGIQLSAALRKLNSRADRYFESISVISDMQVEVAAELLRRKEDVLLGLMRGLSVYYDEDTFLRALSGEPEEQTLLLRQIGDTAGVAYLFVTDEHGNVVFGSSDELTGVNIVERGLLSREDLESALKNENAHIGLDEVVDKQISIFRGDPGVTYAPFSTSLRYAGASYHIIALAEYDRITDDSTAILNADFALGKGSDDEFVIELMLNEENIEDSFILFCKSRDNEMTLEPYSALGLSREALANGFGGIERIDGRYYYCRTEKAYIYDGEYGNVVIIVASDLENILDLTSLILPTAVLLWFILYLYAYGMRMRQDLQIMLPEVDLLRDYARRLTAVALIGILAVFAAAFYCQTISSLSMALRQTKPGLEQLGAAIDEIEALRRSVYEADEEISISQASLVRLTVEADPAGYFADEDPDAFREYARTDAEGYSVSLKDDFGHPLRSVCESSELRKLCDSYDMTRITLYNADGYAVADSGREWYSHIERDLPETAALFEVLDRRRDALVLSDESSPDSMRIAVPIEYYVRDLGNETGFVSKDEYLAFLRDPENLSEVRRRNGLMVCRQNDPDIMFDTESETLDFIARSRENIQDCEFVITDLSGDHKIFYDGGIKAETADELGIPEEAFSGNYNGFRKYGGEEYFICARRAADKDADGLLVVSMYPLDSLYDQRLRTSLLIPACAAILLALLTAALLLIQRDRGRKQIPVVEPQKKDARNACVSNINLTVIAFALALSIFVPGGEWYESALQYILSCTWEHGINLFSLSMCGYLISAMFLLSWLLKYISASFRLLTARGETLARLAVSAVKYTAGLFVIFYSLSLFGLDTTSVLRSLGAFSLIVGLGAQSLIRDVIAGIFVVFEGSYRVGDIVQIKNFRGQVEEIALRTTKLRNLDGNVMIFSNSSISDVENLSAHSSCVYVNLHVPLSKDPDEIRNKIMSELPKICARIPEINGGIEYDGITDTSANGYVIRLIARCRERDRGLLWRKMNYEIIELNKKLGLS